MNQDKVERKISWRDFKAYQKSLNSLLAAAQKDDKALIAFIGNTKVGKSTCINRLMGVNLILDEDNDYLTPDPSVANQPIHCEISHEIKKSGTTKPKIVATDTGRLAYVDLPGQLHVAREDEDAQTVETTLPNVLKSSNIHGFVVCIRYAEIIDNAGQGFLETLEKLARFFPDDILRDKVCFCFTKTGPTESIAKERILQCLVGSRFKNIVTANNLFIFRSRTNPNLDTLKARCILLNQQPAIASNQFTLTGEPPHTKSGFKTLAKKLKAKLATFDATNPEKQLIKEVLEAIQHTATAYHTFVSRTVHAPDIKKLCGEDIKKAIAKLLVHYTENEVYSGAFAKDDLVYIQTELNSLRTEFSQCFQDNIEQLAFFDQLIAGLKHFVDSTTQSVLPKLTQLDATHRRIVANDATLNRVRQLQTDMIEQSHDNNYTSANSTLAVDEATKTLYNNVLSAYAASKDVTALHQFSGCLLKAYQPTTTVKMTNQKLLAQFVNEMIRLEQKPDICGTENLDYNNQLLTEIAAAVKANRDLYNQLEADETFFNGLFTEYQNCLSVVSTAQKNYIEDYQTTVRSSLRDNYANGHAGLTPFTLNLLDNPSTCINHFAGLTINNITDGISSTEIKDLYSAVNYHAPRKLTLTIGPLYAMLRGNIDKNVLAAEYLGLVRFKSANQTGQVEHPTIPFHRGPDGHITSVMATVNPQFLQNNVGSGRAKWALCEGPSDWTITLSIFIQGHDQQIYTAKFVGSYADIDVPGVITILGNAEYCAPGGTGGCYHYQLRKELVPLIHRKWDAKTGTFTLGPQLIATPDINAWFNNHRNAIGVALINCSDPSRNEKILDYKNKLFALDMAVLKLKIFGLLIGKDPDNSVFAQLVTSATINAEITKHKDPALCGDEFKLDLAPCIAASIANKSRLTAASLFAIPGSVSSRATLLFQLIDSQLAAHTSWRVMQKPLPKGEAYSVNPKTKLQDYLKELQDTSREIKLQYLNFTDSLTARLANILRTKNQLRYLSLKKLDFNAKKIFLMLTPVSEKAKDLIKLDISHNPCVDTDDEGKALCHVLSTLILTKSHLAKINVAHTQLGSYFLSTLAPALAHNPTLTEINMLCIARCSDTTGLALLAALFVNTTLQKCVIDSASLNPVIADAIQFIMHHKSTHASAIPATLPERLQYFDNQLKTFIGTRTSVIPNKKTCAVLQNVNLIDLANNIVKNAEALQAEAATNKNQDRVDKAKELSAKNKVYLDFLEKGGFFASISKVQWSKQAHDAWQRYEDFNPLMTQEFGISRQDVKGDGNCQFRAIAVQILQLYNNNFPADLAAHFPAEQRTVETMIPILRRLAIEYIRENQAEFLPHFVAGATEFNRQNTFEEYLTDLQRDGAWGAEFTLQALCKRLNRDIYTMRANMLDLGVNQEHQVRRANNHVPFNVTNTLILLYDGQTHYDTIDRHPIDDRLQRFVINHWNNENNANEIPAMPK